METYEIKHKARLHTVLYGETLQSIAAKYNTTAHNIKKHNAPFTDLSEGDMLYIGNLDKILYVVMPLDTLEKIAAKFKVSKETICKENDIKTIYIGQHILI